MLLIAYCLIMISEWKIFYSKNKDILHSTRHIFPLGLICGKTLKNLSSASLFHSGLNGAKTDEQFSNNSSSELQVVLPPLNPSLPGVLA